MLRLGLDLDTRGGVERGDGAGGRVGVEAVEAHLPDGGGQPLGEAGGAGVHRIGDVEAVRQRAVEQLAQEVGVARLREGD
ncbi:hypothetical protein, partial [Streptomyces cyaneofuscatus]|uniref:hypothetical protein n=1 Tax=Streptomyces cyaneofuscatus TaxID=66883 RepID=UPI0019449C6A